MLPSGPGIINKQLVILCDSWIAVCRESLCSYINRRRREKILRNIWWLIRALELVSTASTQVVLTVQQKPAGSAAGLQVGSPTGQQHQRPASLIAGSTMVSPTQPATSLHRASTAPAGGALPACNARITGPQPVDVSQTEPTSTIIEPVCLIAGTAVACALNADTIFRTKTSVTPASTHPRSHTLTDSSESFSLTHQRAPTSPRYRLSTTPRRYVRLFAFFSSHVRPYLFLIYFTLTFARLVICGRNL